MVEEQYALSFEQMITVKLVEVRVGAKKPETSTYNI